MKICHTRFFGKGFKNSDKKCILCFDFYITDDYMKGMKQKVVTLLSGI